MFDAGWQVGSLRKLDGFVWLASFFTLGRDFGWVFRVEELFAVCHTYPALSIGCTRCIFGKEMDGIHLARWNGKLIL